MSHAELVPADEAAAVFCSDDVDDLEPLRPRPLGATVGVWRVRAGGSSAVLKLLRVDASPNPNWASSADPMHPRWWLREPSVLRDGVADRFEPELHPPRLLHTAERPDGALALWLEDLGPPASWTVEGIADVARRLGRAQARIAKDGLPADLARGFLRAYLEPRQVHLAEPIASLRTVILDQLDSAPHTLCHFDLHPANVFPSEERTVVIDWAYTGAGPLGSDAGVLASDAIADEIVPAHEAERLVSAVWEAYRDGLDDDELATAAERVYAVGTAVRYSWLPAWLAGTYGPPIAETRRASVVAAHGAFLERALAFL
ncbi:MAG TPA: phosphotransferase [Gaiellaceae bacterium]|jgi:hypothetical protein